MHEEDGMAGGENRAERQMARDLDDVQAFPLLTSEVGQAAGSRPSAPTPTVNGGSSIGQLAEMALRDILAVRPSTTDPQGIVAALNNAFTVAEVDGRETWAWTPRSYSVQADMGAVTGAQASI